MHFRRSMIAAACLVAACCSAPKPAPTPAPPAAPMQTVPAPRPSPVATYASWMDVPQTPGDWRYAKNGDGSIARFGESASEPRFAIGCMATSRRIVLIRYGPFAGDVALTIRSESATRTLSAKPDNDGEGISAALVASDALLDAIAFSKGRFAAEAAGSAPLYLPSWPEITRVIEDCR